MTNFCKNVTYIFIALAIIIANSLIMVFKINSINNWRLDKANTLYIQSLTVDNYKEKIVLLVESNFLDTTEAKIIEISNIYLRNGDYNKARTYLKKVDNQLGYLKYAEAALEYGDLSTANEYIFKISDNEIKNELNIFKEITNNEERADRIAEIPLAPQTNLGTILKSINTDDYSKITDNTIIGWKISNTIENTSGALNRQLAVSRVFIQNNQPILARILLNQIINNHPNLADAHILKAESYNSEHNYTKALESQLLAINIGPDNLITYQTALEYAKLSNDQNEINWINDNIEYLKEIQSKKYCSTCGI